MGGRDVVCRRQWAAPAVSDFDGSRD